MHFKQLIANWKGVNVSTIWEWLGGGTRSDVIKIMSIFPGTWVEHNSRDMIAFTTSIKLLYTYVIKLLAMWLSIFQSDTKNDTEYDVNIVEIMYLLQYWYLRSFEILDNMKFHRFDWYIRHGVYCRQVVLWQIFKAWKMKQKFCDLLYLFLKRCFIIINRMNNTYWPCDDPFYPVKLLCHWGQSRK